MATGLWQRCMLLAWPSVAARLCPSRCSAVRVGLRSFTSSPTCNRRHGQQEDETSQGHKGWQADEALRGSLLRPMDIRLGRTTRPPPARVRRAQRHEETAALPYVSVDEFARLVACGQATPEHARSCIYNLATRLGDQNLPERREEYAAYHAGGRVLSWLLLQDLAIRDELSRDRLFVDAVTLFLVAEAREDIVWKWLKLEPCPPFNEEKTRHMWVAGLIVAQRKWHTSVVPALSTLRKAVEEFTSEKGDMLISASVVAENIAQSATLAPYDPALFDAVLEAIHRTGPSIRANKRCSWLLLFHPVNPSADLLLQLQREQVEPGVWSARPAALHAFGAHALRAAYILHLQNRADDASWFETLVRDRIPAVWFNREQIRARCERDPKLDGLRRDYLALRDPRCVPIRRLPT